MKGLIEEINEIPFRAQECLAKNKNLILPDGVPYIGMGSSYYAPLTLQFAPTDITPQIASEYYYYLSGARTPQGVLLSQSGESSETVWNLEKIDQVVAITNNPESTLATHHAVKQVVEIYAGAEQFSSTKTYVNTLITLYQGLGIDCEPAVELMVKEFNTYSDEMSQLAAKIAAYQKQHQLKGLFIIGSGPNAGTAHEAALTLSETTKLSWMSMPVAQYDHGPKETANDTIVIALNSSGKDAKRIAAVKTTLNKSSNALFLEVAENNLEEKLTPIPLIVRMNILMNALADELAVGNTFNLGGKVTTVSEQAK